jgi:hypothetical protein
MCAIGREKLYKSLPFLTYDALSLLVVKKLCTLLASCILRFLVSLLTPTPALDFEAWGTLSSPHYPLNSHSHGTAHMPKPQVYFDVPHMQPLLMLN